MMKSKSNKGILVTVICAVFVAAISVTSAFIAREKLRIYVYREVPDVDTVVISDYFPLSKGNYWVYEGVAANAVLGGEIIEKPIRLTMEVNDIFEFRDGRLCLMRGHPIDAAWMLKPEHRQELVVAVPPKEYGYLIVSNKIFSISKSEIASLKKCLQEPPAHQAKDCWFDGNFLDQDDLEFEFPLFKGQRFGPTIWLARSDKRYFWYVKNRFVTRGLEGSSSKSTPEFELIFNTFPGRIELRFVPYVGITAWKYVHHGTKSEVDMSLVDYDIHLDQ